MRKVSRLHSTSRKNFYFFLFLKRGKKTIREIDEKKISPQKSKKETKINAYFSGTKHLHV